MKKRNIVSVFILVFVILGLFAACTDPNQPALNQTGPGSDPVTPASTYTVKFEANGGTLAPNSQTITRGGKIAMPTAITKNNYIFGGWYKEAACINKWNFDADSVSDNITLYAWWYYAISVSNSLSGENTLAGKLNWVKNNAESNYAYIIEVTANENLTARNLSYAGKNNIVIQLKGTGNSNVITLSSNGSLFSIENSITLILEGNLTLSGRSNNSASLVKVNSGGTLIMNQGAKITGNNFSSPSSATRGGGVYVDNGTFTMNGGEISSNTSSSPSSYGNGVYVDNGTFTMNDGKISGNTSSSGGGVYVINSGTFSMNGGEISGNTATSSGGGVYANGTFTMSGGKISNNTVTSSSSLSLGGGVYVNGTFTMNGGEISSNTSSSFVRPSGGGVYVNNGTFAMSGGKISGNTSSTSSSYSSSGGGVYVNIGTFTMSGGEISGNTAASSSSSGGGVCVQETGTFTMSSGEISGNTATYGGGVYTRVFTMSGGEITGNTASSSGGGVCVTSFFFKTGGTIYGYVIGDNRSNVVKNSGVVQNNMGHAIYVNFSNSSYIKRKETIAGPTVNLSFTYYYNPPSWTGAWDN